MVSAWSGVQHAMAEAEIPQAKGTAGSIPLWGWEEVPSSHPMAQQCCFTGVFDAQGRRVWIPGKGQVSFMMLKGGGQSKDYQDITIICIPFPLRKAR